MGDRVYKFRVQIDNRLPKADYIVKPKPLKSFLHLLDGNGSRHAGSLHGNSTTDHLAGRSVRYLITGNAAPRNQEVVHLLWNRDHIGNLNVSPGRWYDDDTVAVLFVN